jgi:hypothetical protein
MGAAWEILQHKNRKPVQPAPTPQHWDPTTFHAPPTRSGATKTDIPVPPVPAASKSGKTSVDTPSLDLFASNVDAIAEPVKQAYQKLMQLQAVHPGAFYDAYMLRSAASGANGDQGIQSTYLKVLKDLGQGLSDISSGVRTLSKKYTTVEEDNKMTADDLSNAMESAQSDFSSMNSGS